MKLLDDIKQLTGQQEPAPKPPAKTIVIIEDEQPLADVLAARFIEEGFLVFKAANGEEGLAVIQKNNPDVVLLDLMMPVLDGKAMLGMLRKIPGFKITPVIVLTNAGEIDNIKQTLVYFNAVEFLIKSNVSVDEIVAQVKKHTLATNITKK